MEQKDTISILSVNKHNICPGSILKIYIKVTGQPSNSNLHALMSNDEFWSDREIGSCYNMNNYDTIIAQIPTNFNIGDSCKIKIIAPFSNYYFENYDSLITIVDCTLSIRSERKYGILPIMVEHSRYRFEASNPFTADSGTGNVEKDVFKFILKSKSAVIDSIHISSDMPYIKFRTRPGIGKQNPILNYSKYGLIENLNNDNLVDLDVIFEPPTDMKPGIYNSNLLLKSMELNDSGFINIALHFVVYYNPYEWLDNKTVPGIMLELISRLNTDTCKMIFGSGYKSRTSIDTTYGEASFHYYFSKDKIDARFSFDNNYSDGINCLMDISPKLEQNYSNSRDIKPFINDTIPLIYHVKFNAKSSDYPIKLEYYDYNFPNNSLFILTQSLDSIPLFKLDMKKIDTIYSSRHQFMITDTNIKEFYIAYYKTDQVFTYIEDIIPKSMFCAGDSLVIPFKTFYPYSKTNQFIVELSKPDGSWDSPMNIGHLDGSSSGKIKVRIPLDAKEGKNYKIRIKSTSPLNYGREAQVLLNIFPGIVDVCTDTLLYVRPGFINIRPISPQPARFYYYDSLVGGKLLGKFFTDLSLYLWKDSTIFIEAESLVSSCKTTKRVKVNFHFFVNEVRENNSNQNILKFEISPNPANDYISISIINRRVNPAVDKVEIYDILGILYTPPNPLLIVGEQLRLDVSGFVPGVYFVKVGDRVSRFIKL